MQSLLKSVVTKGCVSAGAGYGFYQYLQWKNKQFDMNDFFVSGYQYKFFHINNMELNKEEVQSCSDKFTYYGDLIKKHNHTDREISVVNYKGVGPDFCSINNDMIHIPMWALLPSSIIQQLHQQVPELRQLLKSSEANEGILFHELGHIVHNHLERRNKMKSVGVSLAFFSLFKGVKYAIPTFIITGLSLLWYEHQQEYEADAYAVKHGYGPILIKDFEQSLEFNKTYGDSIYISPSGNNLDDIYHPLYTDRIKRIYREISYLPK
jgi:hypothetical protein